MKKFGLLFVVVLSLTFSFQLSAQNVSPQFSELKGMEDAQGNTHLFYRISSSYEQGYFSSDSNLIYNFVPHTLIDTIFLYDGGYCDIFTGYSVGVSSYDFWNQDPTKFIYCGMQSNCYEGSGYISRYDSQYVRNGLFETYIIINISKQNDSLLYCAYPIMRSTNGGFNWEIVSDSMTFLSLSPFNDQVYFAIGSYYWWGGCYLYKTTDGGSTFGIVDTLDNSSFSFYYDQDGSHIYRTDLWNYPYTSLKRSSNQGNAFTWENIYTADNNFYLSLDESQSGEIYLADKNKIMYSSDYGTSFSLFKEFNKRIIGLYKKPNSNKLYAATKYKIYEITDSTIEVIKSLPVIDELAFYPLKVGNKWIYDYTSTDWNMNSSVDIYFREVLSEKVKQNGKKYFEILEKYVYSGIIDTVYERIDSTEGKVYRYVPDCPNSEQFIEELVLEDNDSSFASRFESCIEHAPTELLSTLNYSRWGINGKDRNYYSVSLLTSDYNLFSDIGLAYIKLSDDNYFRTYNIKGMIKNGIVYGDTTLTDIIVCIDNLPTSYSLNQNYPNPFNPTTKITWQSPVAGNQTLKVYDVLGNEVATLVDEFRNAGIYEIDFDASALSSGVYFYRFKSGSFIQTMKMILLK